MIKKQLRAPPRKERPFVRQQQPVSKLVIVVAMLFVLILFLLLAIATYYADNTIKLIRKVREMNILSSRGKRRSGIKNSAADSDSSSSTTSSSSFSASLRRKLKDIVVDEKGFNSPNVFKAINTAGDLLSEAQDEGDREQHNEGQPIQADLEKEHEEENKIKNSNNKNVDKSNNNNNKKFNSLVDQSKPGGEMQIMQNQGMNQLTAVPPPPRTCSVTSKFQRDALEDLLSKDPSKKWTCKRNDLFGSKISSSSSLPLPQAPDSFSLEQKKIVDAFLHAWQNYVAFSFGHDEYVPQGSGGFYSSSPPSSSSSERKEQEKERQFLLKRKIAHRSRRQDQAQANEKKEEQEEEILIYASFDDWGVSNQDLKCQGTGIGVTAIEAVPSLYLMGLHREVDRVAEYLGTEGEGEGKDNGGHTFSRDTVVSLFETTIRVLGGLLSAFQLTKRQIFLTKAVDLGNRLMAAFRESPTDIPYSNVNLKTKRAGSASWHAPFLTSTAEVTSIQLEFVTLSELTGDLSYAQAALKAEASVLQAVLDFHYPLDLIPMWVDANRGRPINVRKDENAGAAEGAISALSNKNFFVTESSSLGANGDSYYEYVVKLFILLDSRRRSRIARRRRRAGKEEESATHNKNENQERQLVELLSAAWNKKLRKSIRSNFVCPHHRLQEDGKIEEAGVYLCDAKAIISERLDIRVQGKKQDELACFASGMFLLSAEFLTSPSPSLSSSDSSSSQNQKKKLKQQQQEEDRKLATQIGETCFEMWNTTLQKGGTGLAGESANFYGEGNSKIFYPILNPFATVGGDANYLLRPETFEAFFYLRFYPSSSSSSSSSFSSTSSSKNKDKHQQKGIWQKRGEQLFDSILTHCKVEDGFKGVADVTSASRPVFKTGKLESFFLSETLKYAFLLASSEEYANFVKTELLENWIFNTEGHPLKKLT